MEPGHHTLAHLFHQLGLAGDGPAIDAFVHSHRLPAGTPLSQATFWNPAQAQFLCEALAQDSDWAEAADELAVRLSRHPAH